MPIYDFECPSCGHISELYAHTDDKILPCDECGADANRLFSFGSRVNTSIEDADWIRSVTDIVDKDNPAPHVQAFLKNPTRTNWKNWMKGEGLRPFEPGERPSLVDKNGNPKQPFNPLKDKQFDRALKEKFMERESITIR